jgi:hypothetical protein
VTSLHEGVTLADRIPSPRVPGPGAGDLGGQHPRAPRPRRSVAQTAPDFPPGPARPRRHRG